MEVFKIAVSFSNAIKWAYSAWEGDSNSRDSSDVCGRSASLRHNDDGDDDDGDDCGIGDFHLGEFQARSAEKAGIWINLRDPCLPPSPGGLGTHKIKKPFASILHFRLFYTIFKKCRSFGFCGLVSFSEKDAKNPSFGGV